MSFQNDRITSIPAPLPLDYDRQYSFTNWETNNPGVPYPASGLEAEFNAIQQALDETQARVRLIQDDDGSLLNESVGADQLKSEVLVGVNAPTNWATTTSYAVSDTVFQSNIWYYCLEAHVSDPSSFATDLGAGKWRELLDLTTVITVEAQNWANYPEDSLVPEGDLVDDYSALHHANKAAASAAAAAASAVAAATVPDPSGGSANDLIRRNGAGTAYELFTPTAEATAATADTLALRDGSGRMKAADPAASDDVATQGWAQTEITTHEDSATVPHTKRVYTASITGSISLPTIFSDNPGYKYFKIVFEDISLTGSAYYAARVSIDGSTYEAAGYEYSYAEIDTAVAPVSGGVTATAQNHMRLNSVAGGSGVKDHLEIVTINPHDTGKKCPFKWKCLRDTGTVVQEEFGLAVWDTQDDLTGFQLYATGGAGSIASQGTVSVYASNVPF